LKQYRPERQMKVTTEWAAGERGAWADDGWLARVVGAALTAGSADAGPGTLGLLVCSDDEIRALNRVYRAIDETTDVLSFSQMEGEAFPIPEGAPRPLGDIAISLETAALQAAERERELPYEFAHLLVHGVLHLLGFDHEEANDEAEMRQREDEALVAIFGAADRKGWVDAGS
jgi:probable rRNA maturation factor